tara:strand:- start:1985 stop:2467 length:483 start_codon:yes stop_codon:yes gene_type:complete
MELNNTENEWQVYIHYPNDINWNLDSYKLISNISNIETAIELFNLISEDLYTKCMFFLMRNNISPIWEDKNNINGGAFSYKINNLNTKEIWKKICYQAIGETLLKDISNCNNINGITISPKKNFSILKIWTRTCDINDPECINYFDNFTSENCIFKKHIS